MAEIVTTIDENDVGREIEEKVVVVSDNSLVILESNSDESQGRATEQRKSRSKSTS